MLLFIIAALLFVYKNNNQFMIYFQSTCHSEVVLLPSAL